MTDETVEVTRAQTPNFVRYFGLTYGVVGYVLAIAYWPLFILFISNLPRLEEPLWPKSVSFTPDIMPTWQALAINVSLLLAFALHHSFLARPGVKKIWSKFISPPFRRSTFVHIANVFAYAIIIHWQPMPISLWQFDPHSVLRILILTLFALGWIMLLWGAMSFDLTALFGLRQVLFWYKGIPYEPIDITTSHSYRFARHPEFLGLFLGLWITADMTAGHFLLAATFTIYSLIALRQKEKELARELGPSYVTYKKEVPMLGPHWLSLSFLGFWLAITATQIYQTIDKNREDHFIRADLKRFSQAMVTYRDQTGAYPDTPRTLYCEHPNHKTDYDRLMSDMVKHGVIDKPFAHPNRKRVKDMGYCLGVLAKSDGGKERVIFAELPSSNLSNTGEPGTCRPFVQPIDGRFNFCHSNYANHFYCLCLP